MQQMRRLYFYGVSGLGLALSASGAYQLLALLLGYVFAQQFVTSAGVRQQVATYVALLVIGTPVWLIHWALAQRQARASAEEDGGAVRHLFLNVALAVGMVGVLSTL